MTIDFRDPTFRSDPERVFRELRENSPVARIEGLASHLVTRHEDCSAILSSKKFGFERVSGGSEEKVDYLKMRESLMIFQNSPDHQASRRSGGKILNRKSAAEIEGIMRRALRSLIESQRERGGRWDFIADFVQPFSWKTITELLDHPVGDPKLLGRLTRELTESLDPLGSGNSPKRAGVLFRSLEGAFKEHAKGCPFGSEGSADEVLMLVMASTFTTNHILGLVVSDFLGDPKRRDLIRSGWGETGVTGEAIEEIFRYYSPVQLTRRVALEDVVLNEQVYRAGTVFWISLRSANYDSEVFTDPETLDFERSENRHLSFGKGVHHCLGANLARMQLRVFLEEFCGAFPGLTLRSDETQKVDSLVFRGVNQLILES